MGRNGKEREQDLCSLSVFPFSGWEKARGRGAEASGGALLKPSAQPSPKGAEYQNEVVGHLINSWMLVFDDQVLYSRIVTPSGKLFRGKDG